jgi:hypothetical protein
VAIIGGKILLRQKIKAIAQEVEKARNEKRNGGGERNGYGFGQIPF